MSPTAQAPPAPPPPYHVQTAIDKIKTFAHHDTISALWNQKWRFACAHGIYPFVDGNVEDFDPIFKTLVDISGDNPAFLHDPDAYAAPFFPIAEGLVQRAKQSESDGDTKKACELYLRAGAVYRIARFPVNRSKLSQKAWVDGKAAYLAGGRYLDPPVKEVIIPYKHASAAAGEAEHDTISAFLRIPSDREAPASGWPVLLFINGLDAYKTDHTNRTSAHVSAGFAVLSVEIPGTGDCPAAANDPMSPVRLFSSILDWIAADPDHLNLDAKRVVARGVSTGGYYAFMIAHTHADRLLAVVSQGGGSHYMFDPAWIDAQNHMEYPFALADALVHKFGYKTLDEYKANAMKRFSLTNDGLLDGPCARLLIINGLEDSIFPIEDSLLVASRGRVKDVRLFEGKGHMGNPGAEEVLYAWIKDALKESY